jgi:pyruvate-ferredoxin/flavodoxin oxidoreductase
MHVSAEIVSLAEERLDYWHRLKQMAGLEASAPVHDLVEEEMEGEYDARLEMLRAEYEAKMADLRARYPRLVARRMAEGLVRSGNGKQTVADLIESVQAMPDLPPLEPLDRPAPAVVQAAEAAAAAGAATAVAVAPAAVEEATADEFAMEPYIETARCTTCHECVNLNRKMFAYNDKKQAVIQDPRAGTFREIVMAAEKCPVKIIHPGTPLNPKEKNLDKWVERAARFN